MKVSQYFYLYALSDHFKVTKYLTVNRSAGNVTAMTNTSPAQRVSGEVRAAMARKRVTQSVLAAHLGISQAALSRRLRGEIPFDVNELALIASHLDVTIDALIPTPDAAAS